MVPACGGQIPEGARCRGRKPLAFARVSADTGTTVLAMWLVSPRSSAVLLAVVASGAAAAPGPSFSGSASPLPAALRATMTGVCGGRGVRSRSPISVSSARGTGASTATRTAGDRRPSRRRRERARGLPAPVRGPFSDPADGPRRRRRRERLPVDRGRQHVRLQSCRTVDGRSRWSEHAYGRAIDLNPIENPYVGSSGTTSHRASTPYLRRSPYRPGMAVEGGTVVSAFDAIAWGWGGRWSGPKDYQHFSASGR